MNLDTSAFLNKARLKPVSSATETGLKNENSPVESLDMIISNK